MKSLAYLSILCLVLLFSLQAQADYWIRPAPTQTPVAQSPGSAMTYGLYEGRIGKFYCLLPIISSPQNTFWSMDYTNPYDPRWDTLPDLPLGVAWTGSNLCYYHSPDNYYTGAFIFCTKGNDTNQYWCYYVHERRWRKLEDIKGNVYFGRGMSLVVGDTGRVPYGQPYVNIYLLKGVTGNLDVNEEFLVYRFIVPSPGPRGVEQSGNWKYLASFSHGAAADITYRPSDGTKGALYAFRGRGHGDRSFCKYDIATNSWTEMEPFPEPGVY
jgi:hypothetical protein